MNIEQRINTDYLKAFKERNVEEKMLLGTIKGEFQTIKKNLMVEDLSDVEALKILDKFAKNLKETMLVSNDEKFKRELAIIENYLPKQLSESEINQKLEELISSGVTNFGMIMKEFANLPVDKKSVSEIVKKRLV